MEEDNLTHPRRATKKVLFGVLRLLLGLVLLGGFSYLIMRHDDILLQYAKLGYLGIFVSCVIANSTVFMPAPSLTVVFLFASVYSPFWVAVLGALGASTGEILGYLVGRSGHNALISDKYQKVYRWTQTHGMPTIFLFAFLPLPLFDLVGVSSGILNIPFVKFYVPTFFGKLLKMLIYAYVGAGVIPLLYPFVDNVIVR